MAKRIEKIDIESGDIFKGIKDSAKSAESEVQVLAETLKIVTEQINTIKTSAKNVKIQLNPSNLKDINEQNKAEREAIRLANAREKAEKQSIELYNKLMQAREDAQKKAQQQEAKAHAQREKQYNKEIELEEKRNQARNAKKIKEQQSAEESLQRQREKGIAQMQREKAKEEEKNRAYNVASARLNQLRKDYKDLALAGRENESASKAMKREINSLDATLKKVDASVGQYQRNVGNYSSAFSKLSGAMGVFGVSLGIGAVVKGAFTTIKDFDQSLGNLASVLGTTADRIPKLEENAKRLGATTRFTATEVNQLQTELAKLGFTEGEILNATDGVLALAGATGTDLARSAEVAGSTLRAFQLDASEMNRVVDVMAKSFSTSALDTEKFAESMKYVAPIAKSAGVSIEETTAMLGALANAGISGSNAGTALRRILSEMATSGKPAQEALKDLAEKGLDLAGAEDEVGKNAMSALLILNEQNGKVKELTETYQNAEGEAQKMADTQLNTLAGSIDLLTSAWDGFVMGLNDASGAGDGLAKTIKFIADNLPTIISYIGKLTLAFISFKLVQGAVNTNFKDLIKNFTSLRTATEEGSTGMSKFGSALKGVGWTVAIGLAIDFAMSLYDVASGAQAAREQHDALQKSIKAHNKEAEKLLSTQQKAKELNLQALNDEAKRTKMSETEYKKRVKLIEDEYKAKVKGNIRFTNDLRDSAQKEAREIAKMLKIYNAQGRKFTGEFSPEEMKNAREYINALGGSDEAYKRIDALKLSIASSNEELKVYNGELKALNPQVEVLTDFTDKNTTATNKNAKAVKDKNKKYQDATKVIDELIAKEKELEDARLARQMELGEGIDQANRDVLLSQMTAEEQELQAVQDKYQRLEDLAEEFGYGQEELLQARLNEENEIKMKYLKMELDELDKQQQELEQKEKEALERRRQERRKFTDDILTEMDKLSKEEEAKIDERIKAEQELQSNLQAQANAGNISAQQSIEASKEAERKATLEKQKEQQKQQRIEDVKTLLNLINQYIDKGDNVAIATTKGIAGLGIIKAIAKGLSGFATGTEWRLGDEHKAQMGGVDGHIVRVDSSEAIIKGSLMDKAESVGIGSTDELVKLAVMQKMNDGTNGFQPSVQVGYKIDTTKIEKRLESLENTIKNKPEVSFDPYIINGIAKGVVHTQRKGNFTRKDLYKS